MLRFCGVLSVCLAACNDAVDLDPVVSHAEDEEGLTGEPPEAPDVEVLLNKEIRFEPADDTDNTDESPETVEEEEETEPVLALGLSVHLEDWAATDPAVFNEWNTLILERRNLFESYGAPLTLESASLTAGVLAAGDVLLIESRDRGHGVGLHAALSTDSQIPASSTLAETIQSMSAELAEAGVEAEHISGICSAEDWVSAALAADLWFVTGVTPYCLMSLDEADRPEGFAHCEDNTACIQPWPAELADQLHPWRMADGKTWTAHDPDGELVHIPTSGRLSCLSEHRADPSLPHCDFDHQDVEAYVVMLEEALALVDPEQTNSLVVTWSFGAPHDLSTLAALLEAVVPYVASGQVEWKSLNAIHDDYLAWEAEAE